jgi:hypothetical protein
MHALPLANERNLLFSTQRIDAQIEELQAAASPKKKRKFAKLRSFTAVSRQELPRVLVESRKAI